MGLLKLRTHAMKRIAQTAAFAALLVVCAPPAPVHSPPSPDSGQPDCAAWESGRFGDFLRDSDIDLVRSCLRAGADPNARDDDNRTPLHEAVRRGEGLGVIAALLAGGADVNSRDWMGLTPLHTAAAYIGNPAVVTALVESGADVNARDARSRTPLHLALDNRDPAVARVLLALGADPLARDDRGTIADPVHCEHWNSRTFAATATTGAVARCIEAGADIHARYRSYYRFDGEEGNTPLHQASMYENGANVDLLLEAGADVDARNKRGETPLMVAAQRGQRAAAVALLAGGAEVNAQGEEGLTALHWAVDQGTPEVVELFLEAGADVHAQNANGATPLFGLERRRSGALQEPAVLDLLLGAGADVGARNSSGSTALHVVAAAPDAPNALQIASGLLESGADPNAYDDEGRTPLILAARGDNEALVRVLLEAGADVAARHTGGGTALHSAVEAGGSAAVVQVLLEAGADPDARDNAGLTPLQELSPLEPIWYSDDPPLRNPAVAPLLEAGADVNVRDSAGNTPLHHAATGDSAQANVLLAAGADVHARNRSGDTPLHIRAMSRRGYAGQIAAKLVRAGADLGARNDEGLTPMLLALRSRNTWVVDELLALGADPETLKGASKNGVLSMCGDKPVRVYKTDLRCDIA